MRPGARVITAAELERTTVDDGAPTECGVGFDTLHTLRDALGC